MQLSYSLARHQETYEAGYKDLFIQKASKESSRVLCDLQDEMETGRKTFVSDGYNFFSAVFV